jgi:hypothetical protein
MKPGGLHYVETRTFSIHATGTRFLLAAGNSLNDGIDSNRFHAVKPQGAAKPSGALSISSERQSYAGTIAR